MYDLLKTSLHLLQLLKEIFFRFYKKFKSKLGQIPKGISNKPKEMENNAQCFYGCNKN